MRKHKHSPVNGQQAVPAKTTGQVSTEPGRRRFGTAEVALAIALVSAAGTSANAYFTHAKVVRAQFAVVGYEKRVRSPEVTVLGFHSVVNNTGTQPITVLSSETYAVGPGLPRRLLVTPGEQAASFSKPFLIEPGKQANVDNYVYFDKDLVLEGVTAEQRFQKEGKLSGAQLRIEVEVLLFGADCKYRLARSEPFTMITLDGRIGHGKGIHRPAEFTELADFEMDTVFP